ncbi:hypothetical protein TNIN_497671 [Trichonephila inaurata madagascariensis]|uniref:Uncharacterized protein n=1 Tax=Trichonephila inaurata madagascariensis TaxID=2747483 RepID=A0A8X6XY16_9ARAC|nr:hypothetical protein TNIN_497671 [Trichonephila inaurata madagascariensis]
MSDKLFAENSMIPCGDRMAKATRAARSKEAHLGFDILLLLPLIFALCIKYERDFELTSYARLSLDILPVAESGPEHVDHPPPRVVKRARAVSPEQPRLGTHPTAAAGAT